MTITEQIAALSTESLMRLQADISAEIRRRYDKREEGSRDTPNVLEALRGLVALHEDDPEPTDLSHDLVTKARIAIAKCAQSRDAEANAKANANTAVVSNEFSSDSGAKR
jgi:hypothetical protein